MRAFLKEHLYLVGLALALAGFASIALRYAGIIRQDYVLLFTMLLPVLAGILLMRFASQRDEEEEEKKREARAAEGKTRKTAAEIPVPRPSMPDWPLEAVAAAAELYPGIPPEELIAEDRRAAMSTRDRQPDHDHILVIDGWQVCVQPQPLILMPALLSRPLENRAVLPVTEPEPVLTLLSDGVVAARYRLDAETGEDFTGQFFHLSVRVYMQGKPAAPAVLIDGFLSDRDDPDETMRLSHIGYRMEVAFVGGRIAAVRRRMVRGRDVDAKALRFPGIITPGNVRYLGICQDCGRSFMFHSYNFPHMALTPAYSDDGMDVCGFPQDVNWKSWECQIGGVRYSPRNAFRCPHCGAPYVDYAAWPAMMGFGTYACVHRGRKCVEFCPDDVR